eukprot:16439953-Heterocapsa_arctica.AAC.1
MGRSLLTSHVCVLRFERCAFHVPQWRLTRFVMRFFMDVYVPSLEVFHSLSQIGSPNGSNNESRLADKLPGHVIDFPCEIQQGDQGNFGSRIGNPHNYYG